MADYIDLDAALAICEKEYKERLRMCDYCGDSVAWNIGNAIKKLPYADVAPVVHGRWIGAPLCGNDNCRCSACGSWHNIHVNLRGEPMQKYCPECGAKMEGDGNADH